MRSGVIAAKQAICFLSAVFSCQGSWRSLLNHLGISRRLIPIADTKWAAQEPRSIERAGQAAAAIVTIAMRMSAT